MDLSVSASRLARSTDVAQFIRSDEWIDLLRVVDGQLITSGSVELKPVDGGNQPHHRHE